MNVPCVLLSRDRESSVTPLEDAALSGEPPGALSMFSGAPTMSSGALSMSSGALSMPLASPPTFSSSKSVFSSATKKM